MAQEIVPQAYTFRGAVDETGDIRDHKAVHAFHIHHAQVGLQGGEMIVGDLRLRVGDSGKEGGFAHVGIADQANVCNDLQLQQHLQFNAGSAGLGVFRGLHGGSGIVHVA